MLSFNWHAALRCTVFEIFAVKWSNIRPKISDLGISGAPPPKGEKICPGPICTIMQNFTPIGATVAEISVTGQRKKTATNIAFHTNVWRVTRIKKLAKSAQHKYMRQMAAHVQSKAKRVQTF